MHFQHVRPGAIVAHAPADDPHAVIGPLEPPIRVFGLDFFVELPVHAGKIGQRHKPASIRLVLHLLDPGRQEVVPHPPQVQPPLLLDGDLAACLVDPDVEAVKLSVSPLGRPAEVRLHDLSDGEIRERPRPPILPDPRREIDRVGRVFGRVGRAVKRLPRCLHLREDDRSAFDRGLQVAVAEVIPLDLELVDPKGPAAAMFVAEAVFDHEGPVVQRRGKCLLLVRGELPRRSILRRQEEAALEPGAKRNVGQIGGGAVVPDLAIGEQRGLELGVGVVAILVEVAIEPQAEPAVDMIDHDEFAGQLDADAGLGKRAPRGSDVGRVRLLLRVLLCLLAPGRHDRGRQHRQRRYHGGGDRCSPLAEMARGETTSFSHVEIIDPRCGRHMPRKLVTAGRRL